MGMSCFVYMLLCADDTLYTGWTTSLEGRLEAHNRGRGAKYTRARRPVRLVYWEPQPDRRAALRREAALKRLSRAQKLMLIAASPRTQMPSGTRFSEVCRAGAMLERKDYDVR